jgi:hypothetical protein
MAIRREIRVLPGSMEAFAGFPCYSYIISLIAKKVNGLNIKKAAGSS